MTQQQINVAFGDKATILPDGFTRPDHWAKDEIPPEQAFTRWRTWLIEEADAPDWVIPPER